MAYAQQPTATPGMSVGGGNRNVNNLPVGADGREWSNGLFDCLGDAGTCIISCFAPCITYGQIKQRIDHLNSKGYPDPERGGLISNDCMVHGALTCCGVGWVLQFMNRPNVRARYNISGDTATDCLSSWCCTPCELTQEAREIELEENSFQGKN